MNCYIETLSLIKKLPAEDYIYRVENKKMLPEEFDVVCFKGKQTNETPTQYYIWSLAHKQEVIDRMIILVTKECMNNALSETGNRTTYQYYFDKMVEYIYDLANENSFIRTYLEEKYNGSAEKYLNDIIRVVMVPEKMDTNEWKDIVSAITEYDNDSESIKLYFDFTGGSRVASLISLLLLRIIEIQNADVKQIIYADAQVWEDKKLTDCTESYEILSHIENIANANDSKEKTAERIMQELIKMGLAAEEDLSSMKDFDRKASDATENLKKRSEQETAKEEEKLKSDIELSKGLAKAVKQKSFDQTHKYNRMSGFEKLKETRKKPSDLIKDFHEEIFNILYDYEIITYNNSNPSDRRDPKLLIRNAIKANEDYYYKIWQSGKNTRESGVIPELKKWLKTLKNNNGFTPLKTLERNKNIKLKYYEENVNRKFFVKGITAQRSGNFEKYLSDHNIDICGESFYKLSTWERVYYNYGFPFMCMSVGSGNDDYPEIMDYYNNQAEILMQRLEELQSGNQIEYKKELHRLLDTPGALEEAVPYMIDMKIWSVNEEKFYSSGDVSGFIKTLCERIEKVRPYRNAIAHNLDNDFRNSDKQRVIADEIRNWLDEYEIKFVKDGV